MSIPYDEQETVITCDKATKTAVVYSSILSDINKVRKMVESDPDNVKIRYDRGDDIMVEMPAAYIKISPKRKMTEEQRAASAERLRNLRRNAVKPLTLVTGI